MAAATRRAPLLGAEKINDRYAGAVIDGWIAPALTDTNPSPVPWTQREMFGYLRTGITALHGVTAGPMSPVVHWSLGLCRTPISVPWPSISPTWTTRAHVRLPPKSR